MRHLKHIFEVKFDENESKDNEIVQDLKDICIELEDERFGVFINRNFFISGELGSPQYLEITKFIKSERYTGHSKFRWIEVKEYVERIIDYMNINGYVSKVMIGDEHDNYTGSEKMYELGKEIQIQDWAQTRRIRIKFEKNINEGLLNFFSRKKKIDPKIESNVFAIDDVKDICQELKDDGFVLDFETKGFLLADQRSKGSIEIQIRGKKHAHFQYNEILEVIERLKDYLGSCGFKVMDDCVSILYPYGNGEYKRLMVKLEDTDYLTTTPIERFSIKFINF